MSRFTYYLSPNESSRIRAAIQTNFDKYFVQDLGIQKDIATDAVLSKTTKATAEPAPTTVPTAAPAAEALTSSDPAPVAATKSSSEPISSAIGQNSGQKKPNSAKIKAVDSMITTKGSSSSRNKKRHFPPKRADFVWLHTTTQDNHDLRANPDTHIVSQLSGINIFEDKANLALLLQRVHETQKTTTSGEVATDTQPTRSVHTLEAHVINGREEFRNWCIARFGDSGPSKGGPSKGGFWVAKDSRANGAQGLHPFGCDNWQAVLKVIRPKTRFVNQRASVSTQMLCV